MECCLYDSKVWGEGCEGDSRVLCAGGLAALEKHYVAFLQPLAASACRASRGSLGPRGMVRSCNEEVCWFKRRNSAILLAP